MKSKRVAMVLCTVMIGLVLFFGPSFAADLSVLGVGKTRSGTISNIKKPRRNLPVTQDITLRVEQVQGDKAKIFLSCSKISNDTGNAFAGEFDARITQEADSIKLSCETPGKKWLFTFRQDGTVGCQMDVIDKLVSRWGDLK